MFVCFAPLVSPIFNLSRKLVKSKWLVKTFGKYRLWWSLSRKIIIIILINELAREIMILMT